MTDLGNNLTFLDGRELAQNILEQIKSSIKKQNLKPHLVIIQVGNDEATNIYVKMKLKRAQEVNIKAILALYPQDVSQRELEDKISQLNEDPKVSGFFIQTPISNHLDLNKLCMMIDPLKDVDGMNPLNLGRLQQGEKDVMVSATALAVMELLKSIPDLKLESKSILIINRSIILGKPLTAMLLNENATVTVAHSKTTNLYELTSQADIIVTGTGIKNFITSEMIKDEAILIDCGSPDAEVDINSVGGKAHYISPVPGGVGPLTIACLLRNCIKTASK